MEHGKTAILSIYPVLVFKYIRTPRLPVSTKEQSLSRIR